MNWYEKIIAVHLAVTDAVRHSEMMDSDRYFVWQEDGETDLSADNTHTKKIVHGTTDLYTKEEFDPWKDDFEAALNASPYISWSMNSIQFEEETGFYHYEWRWEVI